jgi:ADP-ribose pyrophosphatase YjhB (NUDIX family)
LLDSVQAIARTGLTYASDPYDLERYTKLLELAERGYAETLEVPADAVRALLARDLGYVTTKVGADAAIFDDHERILLVHRSDDDLWGLVSGWVDAGETPSETVVREVMEEVGLVATIDELVDAIGRPAGSGFGPHGAVAVLYLVSVAPGDITISHEAIEARYCAIDEVEALGGWHHNHDLLARRALEARRARKPA